MKQRPVMNRRNFIAYSSASALGFMIPQLATANKLGYLTQFHPVRFMSGLIFDITKAVLVEIAADSIVSSLSSRYYSPTEARRSFGSSVANASTRRLSRETTIKHVPYKASIITLGIADYELHPWKVFNLTLMDKPQTDRFSDVLQYLIDEKIYIKTTGMEYARPAGRYLEPDDLLTIERWKMNEAMKKAHFKNMIKMTKVTAFDSLVAQ